MGRRARKRRALIETRPLDRPDTMIYGPVQIDPTPHELMAHGIFRVEDFFPGGKWDPLRPRPWWQPTWYLRRQARKCLR